MNAPYIHGRRRTFSASAAVDVQNAVLTTIKTEDSATWADMGRVLGKSEDRAAAYANTASPIDLPTFLSGCRDWGGRFADPFLSLVGGRWAETGAVCTSDESAALTLASLLPAVIAIEADHLTEPQELVPHEAMIRRVGRADRDRTLGSSAGRKPVRGIASAGPCTSTTATMCWSLAAC